MELLVCLGLSLETCLYRSTTKERVGDQVERGVSQRPVLFPDAFLKHLRVLKLCAVLRANRSVHTVSEPHLGPARGRRTATRSQKAPARPKGAGNWLRMKVRAKFFVAVSHMDQAELWYVELGDLLMQKYVLEETDRWNIQGFKEAQGLYNTCKKNNTSPLKLTLPSWSFPLGPSFLAPYSSHSESLLPPTSLDSHLLNFPLLLCWSYAPLLLSYWTKGLGAFWAIAAFEETFVWCLDICQIVCGLMGQSIA